MVCIYKITSPTNKVYIGQTWNYKRRMYEYVSLGSCKKQIHIFNSLSKYGNLAHKFEAIHILPEDVTQDILDKYEILYYNQYKDLGFKMMNLREPGSRGKHTEETKRKIGLIRKGKKHSQVTINKMKISRNERTFVLKMTDDSKIKMARAKTKVNKIIEIYDKTDGKLIDTCLLQNQAAEITSLSRSSVARNLIGITTFAGDYIFKYKEIENGEL